MPWNLIGPYHEDLPTALRQAQVEYFEHNYDLGELISQQISAAAETVVELQFKDTYDQLGMWRSRLTRLEQLAKLPIPAESQGRIELLRTIESGNGNSLDNILDIVAVSAVRREWMLYPLKESEILSYFQTSTPTRLIADRFLFKVYSSLGRAEAVSFPLFTQRKPKVPVRMMYVGYTAD